MISVRRGRGGGSDFLQAAPLTATLIAANIVMYFLQMRDTASVIVRSGTTGGSLLADGPVEAHLILWGPMVATGEWWRLLGNGFLHANPLHLGTNMLSLFFIGRLEEPAVVAEHLRAGAARRARALLQTRSASLTFQEFVMLSWALAFFIIAIIAAVFGFTGIAAGAAEIAKVLFVVFVVLFLVSLVAGLLRRP